MKNKVYKVLLSLLMILGVPISTISSAFAAESSLTAEGTYTVPVKSLESAAPIPAVQEGFAKAFGENITVVIDAAGNKTAHIQLQHMQIDMSQMNGNVYNANVKTVTGSTVVTTKTELSPVSIDTGTGAATEEMVSGLPDEITLPLSLDQNNSQKVEITVDFMDLFMGGMTGQPTYPTTVTLTLDMTEITGVTADYTKVDVALAKVPTNLDNYTVESVQKLNNAVKAVVRGLNMSEQDRVNNMATAIEETILSLEEKTDVVDLKDGYYEVKTKVLKSDGTTSMAASAVKGATLTVKAKTITVDLQLGAVTVFGQTAYIDRMEYENPLTRSTWEEATITSRDEQGHVTGVQFVLPVNSEETNVKFYYGGSTRGSEAVLYLGLNDVKPLSASIFNGDGTYQVKIALWNASEDKVSMAASAILEDAKIIVKNGKATMYISTQKMKFGTITAYLQELKVKVGETYINGEIVEKDTNGNPTLFSFELPHEEEYIDVLVNPHVAMMGNQDLPARIKVDYTSLKKTSVDTQTPSTVSPVEPPINTVVEKQDSKVAVGTNQAVQTSDDTHMELIGGLFISSCVAMFYIYKKRLCK